MEEFFGTPYKYERDRWGNNFGYAQEPCYKESQYKKPPGPATTGETEVNKKGSTGNPSRQTNTEGHVSRYYRNNTQGQEPIWI
jgi:hypothetical protein